MEQMGFAPAAIADMRAKAASAEPDNGLLIHPDNLVAVRLLLASQTQWRTVAISTMERAEIRRTGLDYAAVEPAARMAGLEPSTDDFSRFRILEAECLNAWAEDARR